MSIVEAFSVGTPVICSDMGNAGILVIEGITGAKFAACSSEELIGAVKRLKAYRNIYCSTYEMYEQLYTEKQNYKRLIEIYQKSQIS